MHNLNPTDDHNRKIYEQKMKEFGEDVRTVRWSSKRCQYLHFIELINVIPKNRHSKKKRRCSILDVGCGFTDMVDFIHEEYRYIGIEANLAIYHSAHNRQNEYKNGYEVYKTDLMEYPIPEKSIDVVLCCGTLNGFSKKTQFRYIKRMWKLTNQVLAFNFITKPKDKKFYKPDLIYMDAGEVFNFCSKLHPSRIEMVSGYWFGDVTIKMWR